ncbi:MAG: hypothetical protein NT027_10895 [Proteobacteria bacterium]|nr:hypothetical protein [Pseudomonadota bacterium]
MAKKLPAFEGEELLYSYMSEYLDGELPPSIAEAYLNASKGKEDLIQKFQLHRGKYQIAMGKFFAPEPLKHKLRNMVQDDQVRETIEASEIQDIEKSEMWSNIFRRSVLALIVLGAIGLGVYAFMPQAVEKINVIEYIGYEAVAMEEDPDGRLNLPSTDIDEIGQFVSRIPGLPFTPQLLKPIAGWSPEGVSLIDYEVIKVIAVMYKSPERNGEHLHHFMVPGIMKDIPFAGEEADFRGIRFRVYASDKLNLLVWQMNPQFVSVLAGHRSAPELAEIARSGTPE